MIMVTPLVFTSMWTFSPQWVGRCKISQGASRWPCTFRVNDPSPNRDVGKLLLPHIWDEVLHHTPALHLTLGVWLTMSHTPI